MQGAAEPGLRFRSWSGHESCVSAASRSDCRPTLWFQVGARHVRAGETKAGIAALEKAVALSTQRNPRFRAYLAYAYAIDGRPLAARQILSELVALREKQYVSSFGVALI